MPWSEKFHSEALDMKYAVRNDGAVMTEDKIMYSPGECQIIKNTVGEVDHQIHMIKSVFGGEIVEPVKQAEFWWKKQNQTG